jgi:hypothetical protein
MRRSAFDRPLHVVPAGEALPRFRTPGIGGGTFRPDFAPPLQDANPNIWHPPNCTYPGVLSADGRSCATPATCPTGWHMDGGVCKSDQGGQCPTGLVRQPDGITCGPATCPDNTERKADGSCLAVDSGPWFDFSTWSTAKKVLVGGLAAVTAAAVGYTFLGPKPRHEHDNPRRRRRAWRW